MVLIIVKLLPQLMIRLIASLLAIFVFLIIPHKIHASWVKVSSEPVLSFGSGSWDEWYIGSPAVIYDGSNYKMWYEGFDRSLWRIGYATSLNGTTWNKHNSFILEGFDDINRNVHNPRVYYNGQKYLMWYSASDITVNNIHINLTDSPNGIGWTQSTLNVLVPEYLWEKKQNKGISFPDVQKIGNEYKIWYGAFGEYNSKTTWRIGYATSVDGVTWVKHPEPVLEPSELWEGNGGIGNPSVLYENGVYHMWYHGDRDIGHATSSSGIKWIKDKDNPVLKHTANPDDFDYARVMDPFLVKKDGIYNMYYTGENKDGRGQIGLATESAIVAPTNTPTPTLTPTPTVSLFSPIIIIPGLGASWNPKDIFSCNLSSSNNWKMTPFISVYKRLINTLTRNAKMKLNNDLFVYNYDWRQPLDKQGEKLKDFIDKILLGKSAGTKVRLIGHSLGGLVIRSYLTNNPGSHRAESILTLGTPHQGTVLAYPLWEKGEIWTDDKMMKWILNHIINRCKLNRSNISSQIKLPQTRFRTPREVLQLLAPSIKSLLPTFSYLRQNGNPIEELDMKYRNDWLPSHLLTDLSNVSLNTLSGNDVSTLRFLDVVNPSFKEKLAGDWLDGKPLNNEKINEGDGTILKFSSQIEGAGNKVISGNHGDVVYATAGIEEILSFLGFFDVKPAEEVPIYELTSKNILAISIDKTVDFKIVNPKGITSLSQENLVVQFEPRTGTYRLKIPPSPISQVELYADFIGSDQTTSQSFILNLKKDRQSEFILTLTNFRTPSFKLISL